MPEITSSVPSNHPRCGAFCADMVATVTLAEASNLATILLMEAEASSVTVRRDADSTGDVGYSDQAAWHVLSRPSCFTQTRLDG